MDWISTQAGLSSQLRSATSHTTTAKQHEGLHRPFVSCKNFPPTALIPFRNIRVRIAVPPSCFPANRLKLPHFPCPKILGTAQPRPVDFLSLDWLLTEN